MYEANGAFKVLSSDGALVNECVRVVIKGQTKTRLCDHDAGTLHFGFLICGPTSLDFPRPSLTSLVSVELKVGLEEVELEYFFWK